MTTPSTGQNFAAATVSPVRGRFGGLWWLFPAFWLLIALASVLQAVLFRSVSLSDALWFSSLQWLPWMLLSPVILWLSSTFTLERSKWMRNIWVHLAACVVIVGGLGALAYYEGPQPGGPPFSRGGPPHGEFGGEPPHHDNSHGDEPGHDNGIAPDQGDHHPPRMDHGPDHGPDHSPFPGHDGGFPSRQRHGPPVGFMILRSSTFQLPTFWAIVGVAHALLFSQRARERERRGAELESRLTQARLETLRMQLNPHFLFNTLNSIASLVYDQPRAADEMIASLSELLRLSLGKSDRQEVTLREELNFLDQYLRIEQTRFGDRLRVERDIDAAALDTCVPILILQPLVENAVKHGIEKQLAPAVISLVAQRANDVLRITVSDNGRGPALGPDGRVTEGVGLGNTRARLCELYGAPGSLEYHARDGGGFVVKIQIPWHVAAGTPAPA